MDDVEKKEPLKISQADKFGISETIDNALIVATVTPPGGGEPIEREYPITVPSGLIARDSTATVGIEFEGLELTKREVLIETVERTKRYGQGIKLSAGFSDSGFKVEFENSPGKETKTTIKETWERPSRKD
jgi:hypothetical protein